MEFTVKKNTPVNEKYYPEFKIIEFCFESEELAKEYYRKFNNIISKQEKNYGYVLLNRDRLIYFQTGVNMYGFIINDLKSNFKSIIKNES